jgi:dienelactone hydrolase
MKITFHSSKSIVLALVAFVLASTSNGTAAEPRRFFQADESSDAPYTLPDLLIDQTGRKVTTVAEWEKTRRPEVIELFREHVYGRVPTTPYQQTFTVVNEDSRAMDGAATLKQVAIKVEAEGRRPVTINLSLFIPNARRQPVPAFLLICNRPIENIDPTRATKSEFWPAEEGIARGYAMAAFFNGDVAPDKKDARDDGVHELLDRGTPAPDAWGTLAAWAWGASRCLDYLQTDPAIAKDQVAIIGHSRGGKTALWAGAEDQRFALVCSNDSGCGGAALTRRKAKGKETLPVINRAFPHWFNTNFKAYNSREDALPVDQHMLVALIAPRAVAVHSAEQDLWADPRGEFLSVVHAGPVYRLYGKEALGVSPQMPAINEPLHGDGTQYHIREGKHDLTLADWSSYWDFADRIFGRLK